MASTNIITLADAKSYLNISSTTSDSALADVVATASSIIAQRIGPVSGSPVYDEWYDGGRDAILLRHAPVQSITSVSESWGGSTFYTLAQSVLDDGQPKSSFGYTFDPLAGVLVRRANGVTVRFASGRLNVHVVYVGGFDTVPADLMMAARLLVKHLWSPQRGGARRQGPADAGDPSDFDAFPRMVEEVLSRYNSPGIA